MLGSPLTGMGAGGRFADYKRAFENTDERYALARPTDMLWQPAGMK